MVSLLKDLKESVTAHVQLTGSKEGMITFVGVDSNVAALLKHLKEYVVT